MKKYSIHEIDRMRESVGRILCRETGLRRSLIADAAVEDRLRTYLMVGITMEEMAAHKAAEAV